MLTTHADPDHCDIGATGQVAGHEIVVEEGAIPANHHIWTCVDCGASRTHARLFYRFDCECAEEMIA